MKHTVFYFSQPSFYAVLFKGEKLVHHDYDDNFSQTTRIIADYVGGDVNEVEVLPVKHEELDNYTLTEFKQLVIK